MTGATLYGSFAVNEMQRKEEEEQLDLIADTIVNIHFESDNGKSRKCSNDSGIAGETPKTGAFLTPIVSTVENKYDIVQDAI